MNSETKTVKNFWGQRTLLIVTGASKGIGSHIATEFSRRLGFDSTVILLARSESGLLETKKRILSANSEVHVKVHSIDLSNAKASDYEDILKSYKDDQYELNLLVHNAGTVDCHVMCAEMDDATKWNEYLSLNLYSVTILTSVFLNIFKNGQRCLLNISSLAAIEPFKGLGLYCIGKASREMYFKTLAVEDPNLNIFNYSPGPVETDMFAEIADTCVDEGTRKSFHETRGNHMVKMEDTVAKLIKLLENRCYESGGRADYYDRN